MPATFSPFLQVTFPSATPTGMAAHPSAPPAANLPPFFFSRPSCCPRRWRWQPTGTLPLRGLSLGGVSRTARASILVIGVIGALFLALYVTYLGHSGDFYRLMRRYGITIFFAFTVLAALLYTRVLWQHRHEWSEQLGFIRAQLVLCALLLGLGLASIPARNWLGKDRAENALEWIFALLMQGLFLLGAMLWRRSGFRLQVGRG